jgi:DSF synthase
MGAWNFTIRKAGFAVANEMILSGRLYTAEHLHRLQLVDMVVDDGTGEEAIERSLRAVHPRLRGRSLRCTHGAWLRRSPTSR